MAQGSSSQSLGQGLGTAGGQSPEFHIPGLLLTLRTDKNPPSEEEKLLAFLGGKVSAVLYLFIPGPDSVS